MKALNFKTTVFFVAIAITGAVRTGAVEIPLDGFAQTGKANADNIAFVDMERVFAEHPLKKRLQADFMAELDMRAKETTDLEKQSSAFEQVILSSASAIAAMKVELDTLRKQYAVLIEPLPATASASTSTVKTSTASVVDSSSVTLSGAANISVPGFQSETAPSGTLGAAVTKAADELRTQITNKDMDIKKAEKDLDGAQADLAKRREAIKTKKAQDKDALVKLESAHSQTVLNDLYQLLDSISKEDNITIVIDKNDVLYGQQKQDLTERVLEMLRGR